MEETLEKVKTINIKEVKDRNVLGEGRNSGMGFAMLKKLSKYNFETVQPISPCKDYLAEVIFTENTDIGTSGCGLIYKEKLGIFEDGCAYMAIVIQESKRNSYHTYSTFNADTEQLKKNYENMALFIKYFEDKMKFASNTVIKEANDNQYLVILPIEWTKSTHSISLGTLLLRSSLNYTGGDPMQYLIDLSKGNNIDSSLIYSLLNMLDKIFKNIDKLLKIDEEYLKQASSATYYKADSKSTSWLPHHLGILSFKI